MRRQNRKQIRQERERHRRAEDAREADDGEDARKVREERGENGYKRTQTKSVSTGDDEATDEEGDVLLSQREIMARKADEMKRERSVLSLSPPGHASSQRSVSDGRSTVYRYDNRGFEIAYQFHRRFL